MREADRRRLLRLARELETRLPLKVGEALLFPCDVVLSDTLVRRIVDELWWIAGASPPPGVPREKRGEPAPPPLAEGSDLVIDLERGKLPRPRPARPSQKL